MSSAGKFFFDGDEHYAVGAPKANLLRGQAYLCRDCFDNRFSTRQGIFFEKESAVIKGEQIGSRFGEALCSVDINGDGFDDLVIGAPLYSITNGVWPNETETLYSLD